MNKSHIFNYYNQKAIHYGIDRQRLEKTLELISKNDPLRILDIGCATGYLGETLRQYGHYVVGFDISEKAIQKAKHVLDKAYVVDIENQQFPKLPKFDLIVLSEVIEHLFQPDIALHKIISHLKPKGHLLVSTPNFLYWGHRLQFLFGNFQYSKQGTFDESHVRFFSYSLLKQMLQKNQLNIIRENHLTGGLVGQLLVPLAPQVFASHLIVLSQRTS